MLQWL